MMFMCYNCPNQVKLSKSGITPGGKQKYIVSCSETKMSFESVFDEHDSNLPCWNETSINKFDFRKDDK